MADQTTGGPAFPQATVTVQSDDGSHAFRSHDGMTLRDYFAAKAMQGILACGPGTFTSADGINMGEDLILIAPAAYDLADAMLAAREVKHD